MPTDYPLDLLSEDGSTLRLQVLADFTDPDNQPLAGGGDATLTSLTVTGTTRLNGDVTINSDTVEIGPNSLNLDAAAIGFFGATPIAQPTGDLAAALETLGLVDSPVLGASTVYVTVQAAAPTDYLTPIVVDTTAVTGATYAWDGSAYQKIADLLT